MITGRVMIDRVKEADRMLVPKRKKRTNRPSPKSPYTTDGMPARLMIATRIRRVRALSPAYSAR